ncbi:methylmalonyl-CoA decarboxylase [Escherichia coli]|nr:methylmalonyl-CoA decarboxylase [Escherichia coli]
MSYQYVNVVTINKVAVIEFNYGRKLNALSKVFIDDLMQALSDLNRPEIRCIILRAPSGSKVFSAGHDIHELRLAVAIRSPMMIHCVKSPA